LLLLNAYYVKSFLGKEQSPQIDADVLSMIPQFSKIYKNWRPDSLLKDASLPEINLTFNGWSLPPKRPRPDYNQYVNKILELSKTYNTTGNEEKEEQLPKKKRKGNEVARSPIKEEEEEENKDEEMQKSQKSMWLRSSRNEDRNQFQEDPNQFNQEIFGYEEMGGEPMAPGDLLRRSSRLRSLGYMNFDLDNSHGPPNLNSLFAHSIVRTSSRGLFG
jgi:hypothetical protein